MGGVEKSAMPNTIADLFRDKVITVEDLADFSDGCRKMVLALIGSSLQENEPILTVAKT